MRKLMLALALSSVFLSMQAATAFVMNPHGGQVNHAFGAQDQAMPL